MFNVKFDYKSKRCKAFTVVNLSTKKKHSVIFRLDKHNWSCDCTWNTLKETPCSHIKEAMFFLKKMNAEILAKKLGIKK